MRKKSLTKNYIYNLMYQIMILLLPLISTTRLTRALGPDGLGMFDRTNSITQYFVLVGCLGLNMYGQREIAYCQNDIIKRSKVFAELMLIRVISMGLSLLLFICTLCQTEKYAFLYTIEIIEVVATLIDVTWYLQGMEEFGKVVLRNALVKLIGAICVFVFVKDENDLTTYAYIYTVTLLLGNISVWFYIPKYTQKVSLKELHIGKHIKPMLILFIPQIATSLYNVFDKTMIALLYNVDAEVAFYEQGQKVVKIALSIPTALGTVMMPHVASMYSAGDHEKIKYYISNSIRFTCFVSLPICFGLIAVSTNFVPWMFGDGFSKIADNIMVIAPIIVFVGISNVIGVQYLLPTGRQKLFTISVTVGTLFNLCMNCLFIPRLASIGAAIGSIIAEFFVTITQLFMVRKEIDIKNSIKSILKYVVSAVVMFLFILLVMKNWLKESTIINTVIMVISGAVVYFSSLFLLRDSMIVDYTKKILKRT